MNPEIIGFLTIENGPSWISDQYWNYLQFIPIFLLGFALTLIITPIIGAIAKNNGVVNDTKDSQRKSLNKHENVDRRINPNKVPLLGGLAVLIPFILIIIVFFGVTPVTLPIILGTSILVIGGVLDDIFNLPATIQFLIQIIAATIIALSVVDIEYIKIPFDGFINLDLWRYSLDSEFFPIHFVFPGDIIMIIWILIMINAIKWVGGVDALMESNVAIAFLLLFVIALRTNNEVVAFTSLFLFGSILAFIFYNFPPAKIFSGSTGKSTFGFILAVLAILNDAKVALTVMILLLPLVDFIFVIIKRTTTNRPASLNEAVRHPINIMRMADTNHLHHQFLKLGFSPKQVLMIEVSIALFVGIIAVTIAEAYRLVFLLGIGLVIMLGILIIHRIVRRKEDKEEEEPEPPERESPESRYSY